MNSSSGSLQNNHSTANYLQSSCTNPYRSAIPKCSMSVNNAQPSQITLNIPIGNELRKRYFSIFAPLLETCRRVMGN
jgi:hypothetical protein